jgi:hypothetical protein
VKRAAHAQRCYDCRCQEGGADVFSLFLTPLAVVIGRAGARHTRRVLRLLAVGGVPPAGRPSGAGRARGPRVACRLATLPRGAPHRGGAAAASRVAPGCPGAGARDLCARCWGATLLGHGPHEGPPCAGDGRRLAWRVDPGHSAGGRACTAARARSRGSPGGVAAPRPDSVGAVGAREPDRERPRRLRPGRVGPGACPPGRCLPGDGARPGKLPPASGPGHA